MILLNVHQLDKSFAEKTLFRGVSFGIETNQRVGLLGPNGAGKTTLLRILAGKTSADGGQVTLKKGLRLAYLEQTPTFEPDETILSAIQSKCRDEHDVSLAWQLIAKLELSQFDENLLVSKLSGGWRKRVALARELILEPELLFLDEPTNHFDVSSILWLEEFIKSAPFSVLMITHDRLFLQRVANRILDLSVKNPSYLLSVGGDYTSYLETKAQLTAALDRQEQVLKNTLRRETEWLRRGAKARQKKQTARIEQAYALADQVEDVQQRNADFRAGIDFGDVVKSPKKLIEAKGIAKSYNGKTLFSGVDLLIGPKTRLALMGDNGSGKSTLIKVLLKMEEPDKGTVAHADRLKVAYFEQNRDTLDPQKSVLKNICPEGDFVFYRGKSLHVRSYLDRFLFFGDQANLPVAKLSGGEQARLRLAQLMLVDAQVLVLDEPTNDLDMETLNILEEALLDFNGAVILVTHDRYFMDAVANRILGFPLKGSSSSNLISFANYLQWEEWFYEQKSDSTKPLEQKDHTKAKAKVKLSFKEKYELENIESQILDLEGKLSDLTQQSESSDVISNSQKLVEVHEAMAKLQTEIDSKYERWAFLEKREKGEA